MKRSFTLEYWIDDDWYVGKLKEIPGIFSEGETLDDLEKNIRDTYRMMIEEDIPLDEQDVNRKEIELEIV